MMAIKIGCKMELDVWLLSVYSNVGVLRRSSMKATTIKQNRPIETAAKVTDAVTGTSSNRDDCAVLFEGNVEGVGSDEDVELVEGKKSAPPDAFTAASQSKRSLFVCPVAQRGSAEPTGTFLV